MAWDTSFYTDLLDNLDIGVFVLNSQGEYLYTNRAYQDLISKPSGFFAANPIPLLQQKGWLNGTVWERVTKTRKPVCSVITITDQEHNRVFDALTIGIPIFDGDGKLCKILYTQQDIRQLQNQVQQGIMNRSSMIDMDALPAPEKQIHFIAESPTMKRLMTMLRNMAKSNASILINGPSGCGKEVAARFIHQSSERWKKPFVAVNCAAIPDNLIESELFGYVGGAFTGASSAGKVGLIEAANGGTLFLDEVNSMPLSLQSKLLRVLETKQITRVGEVKTRDIDFRLICASNENLQTLVEEKRFRSDLFYRINIVSVFIPPLKERKEDIVPLAIHYLERYCSKYSCIRVLGPQAFQDLTNYDWPGNVRELKNLMERLVISSPEPEWLIESISANIFDHPILPPAPAANTSDNDKGGIELGEGFTYRSYMDRCERELLEQAIAKLHTPAAVAEAFQLDLSNVYRKLHKHGISSR